MTPDQLSVALRALSLVTLYQAAGAAFFLWLMHRQPLQSAPTIRRLALISAAIAIVLSGMHQTLEAARMADAYAGMADRDLLRLAWLSGNGAAHLAQMLGLALLVLALLTAGDGPSGSKGLHLSLAGTGGAIAALALLLTGHSRIHPQRALIAPLLGVHLLVVAFWFGSLWPLLRVLRDETPAIAAQVVARFSVLAGRLVPWILVAGLGMATLLVADLSVLQKPYGRLLLAKLAGFMLLMLLAAWNRWRLTPALLQGYLHSAMTLRRIIVLEYLLICAVFAATACLTALYSPAG